jgi:hypothetical protein
LKFKTLINGLTIAVAVLFIVLFAIANGSVAMYGVGALLGVLIIVSLYRKSEPKPGEQMNF